MENKEKVRGFIADNMDVLDEVEIKDEDNIFELGYVNSLFAMRLLDFVEGEFNIEVPDEEITIGNFSSINKIMELVGRLS